MEKRLKIFTSLALFCLTFTGISNSFTFLRLVSREGRSYRVERDYCVKYVCSIVDIYCRKLTSRTDLILRRSREDNFNRRGEQTTLYSAAFDIKK